MFQLTASDLLRIWETGHRQSSVRQALAILAVACPDRTYEQLVDLSLGQRDRLLFAIRQWLFGPVLKGLAECPDCTQRLEFTLDISQMDGTHCQETASGESAFSIGGFDLRFRLPRSRDLLTLSDALAPPSTRRRLAASCLREVRCNGSPCHVDDLPDEVIIQLASRVLACDPLQEILLDISCPACNRQSQPLFDICTFLWQEVAAIAKRLLREVHALAGAYGWREADILALSAQRRQAYLDMMGT